jgi:ubiquinone/menaquinone biosynthesis C-methylase UbiE
VDLVDRYNDHLLGYVLRQRLRWVVAALPERPSGRILEIGCGSGVFMYELARHAEKVFGLDLHGHLGRVLEALSADALQPGLTRGSAASLPFADACIDVVVIVSVLEFVPDPAACIREALRVLRARGRLVLVTPRQLLWADTLYRVVSGVDPEADFQGGRAHVQAALDRDFPSAVRVSRPAWLPRFLAPYELVIVERK